MVSASLPPLMVKPALLVRMRRKTVALSALMLTLVPLNDNARGMLLLVVGPPAPPPVAESCRLVTWSVIVRLLPALRVLSLMVALLLLVMSEVWMAFCAETLVTTAPAAMLLRLPLPP